MTGSHVDLHLPPSTADLQPDVDALRDEMERRASEGRPPIRLVTLTNPGNPTGVMIPEPTIRAVSELCASHGAWLIMDNTYEHFAYPGETAHACIEGEHIVNLFSFSKAYGMMGWRVGYIAHPPRLGPALLKAQDTIAICPAQISQRFALGAMGPGRSWIEAQVGGLAEQKAIVLDALHSTIGEGAVRGGSGAIYLFCKLPDADGRPMDDLAVVQWLTDKHGVAIIPGSACGMPGSIRVCYANLPLEKTREAAARLRAGLAELVEGRAELPKTTQSQ